jgi:hypothetical protein
MLYLYDVFSILSWNNNNDDSSYSLFYSRTQSGRPYGPSRIVGPMADRPIEEIDSKVAVALG